MTATNHALTGAAVATVLRQPLLIVPVAFASHFVCDALPHFKMHHVVGDRIKWSLLYAEGALMVVLGFILLAIGVHQPVWLLIVAALIAMSPDVAWYYYGRRGIHNDIDKLDPLTRFHSWIQWSETRAGLVLELAWAGLMIGVILK